MNAVPEAAWLNQLIAGLQAAQLGLLRGLDALGLAEPVHGQPAWPFALRLSGENLLIDLGQARALALTLVVLGFALVLLLVALAWRRGRWSLLAVVPLLVLLAPWPDTHVVLVPANPASFHASPTGFSAASIARGGQLYAQQCVACHGADGRGQGPLAARQPVWPPNLTGPLLWRRADGDLLWHVLHGVQDRKGATTMPGFAPSVSVADAWALIDFMKAQGAGQALRAAGLWTQPIGMPNVTVRCEGRAPQPLSHWRGQRVRLVAEGPAMAGLLEDPRFVTVLLRQGARAAAGVDAACIADAPGAWQAFALVAGTDASVLGGVQLLADRDGWLRARGEPGKSAWSEDDLLCRNEGAPRAAGALPADGLSALIAAMDAEPVRYIKGGFVH